tara:strand:+ start:73 stop:690 length:618 start_codon:yes stop_codon:yes gene_type:complete
MGKFHIFGDSWVRGDGLGSDNTFSWLIAQELGFEIHEFINYGLSGNTNKLIRNQILGTEFKKDDFILVVWTTPHRDDEKQLYNRKNYFEYEDKISLGYFPKYIREVEEYLKGYNYKMTQCFNPIFGYDYILESDIDGSNFIEWGKKNNTLVDIITETWLKEDVDNLWMTTGKVGKFGDVFVDHNHPNEYGSKMIVEKILPYMEKK